LTHALRVIHLVGVGTLFRHAFTTVEMVAVVAHAFRIMFHLSMWTPCDILHFPLPLFLLFWLALVLWLRLQDCFWCRWFLRLPWFSHFGLCFFELFINVILFIELKLISSVF